jgi:EAL and modified HD-GYP domain-containing signal transduction protein
MSQPSNLLLARQPVFNRQMKIHGYQLHYPKHSPADSPAHASNDQPDKTDKHQTVISTINDALDTCAEYQLCDDLPMFIKVDAQLFCGEQLLSLPPKQVVLDVSDIIVIDEQLDNTLKQYRKHHFRFAINLLHINKENLALLPQADYIRLDTRSLSIEGLSRQLSKLHSRHVNAKVIASNIDTQEQLAQCKALDIDLFQGHFLCRPTVVEGRSLNFSQISCLRLIGELQSDDISPDRIAELLSQSPQLSFRLLRLINSATYELPRTIESLKEAVIYLGLDVICHWASLMVLTESSDKPPALVMSTLVRAKMAELLMPKIQPNQTGRAFLVGLFSTIDAMLDIQMQQALHLLPLSDDINQALLKHEGPLGELLKVTIAYEQGHFQDAKAAIDIPGYELFIAYGKAVLWTKDVLSTLFH